LPRVLPNSLLGKAIHYTLGHYAEGQIMPHVGAAV
jgi:hypothetical protein